MQDIKFSVVVPIWNAEKTVEACLESILSQSVVPDEIIVIDGVSTDGTLQIVQDHLRPQDTLISEPDKGVYDAMNKGVAKASGDIVAILNADDYWMPGTCEIVSEAFAKGGDGVGIVHGNVRYIIGNDHSKVLKPTPSMLNYFCLGLPTTHPATFVRKKVYEDLGGYDFERYPICADQDFVYRVIDSGYGLQYTGKVLSCMNAGGLSSTTGFSSEIDLMLSRMPQPRKFFTQRLRCLLEQQDYYYCQSFEYVWFRKIMWSVITLGGMLGRILSAITMRLALRTRIKNVRKVLASMFR